MSNRFRLYAPVDPGADDDDLCELSVEAGWDALCMGARIVWTPDGLPMRRLAPRSKRPIGAYNSRKAGLMLFHESRGHGHAGGEKLALMKCEIDPDVDDFRTQHVRFETVIDGVACAHLPDIVKKGRDGVIEIEEVKHDGRWRSDEDYRRKLEIAGSVFRQLGWRYRVVTMAEIAPTRRVRDNIVQIQAERFVEYGNVELGAVLAVLRRGGGSAPLLDLKAALGGHPGIEAVIKGMMCHGHLRLPLDQRLGDGTLATLVRRTRQLGAAA